MCDVLGRYEYKLLVKSGSFSQANHWGFVSFGCCEWFLFYFCMCVSGCVCVCVMWSSEVLSYHNMTSVERCGTFLMPGLCGVCGFWNAGM